MRFVDLFAGLGGFHQALTSLGHKCVFASEIDEELAALYHKNFGIKPRGDIRKAYRKVPAHEILCAGFPCQPFSKAGEQLGFDCPQWGDLFEYVLKILRKHKPRFILIENVPNLLRHDGGKTWQRICEKLRRVGYDISYQRLSPHMFGVPQIRERAVIVGDRQGLREFAWPSHTHTQDNVSIKTVLDKNPKEAKRLPKHYLEYLVAWQNLIDTLPKKTQLPSFPIWAMEFGATYPYKDCTPHSLAAAKLRRSKGSFGRSLKLQKKSDILDRLPSYARDRKSKFPDWKILFIEQNRSFYRANKKAIDRWLPSIQDFLPSFQKLEWNWKEGSRDLWKTIIQFRASGIRAKRPNAAPSLVALTTSQIPVVPWERRYMTMRECARLQSMGGLKHLPAIKGAGYKALGNAVNVAVISQVAEALVGRNTSKPSARKRGTQRFTHVSRISQPNRSQRVSMKA